MKKRILAVIGACLILCLFGCNRGIKEVHIEFPFEVSDVEKVETYHYDGVPTAVEKKVVTEVADIEDMYAMFERITLQAEKEVEETVGGCVASFRFVLSDGTNYEIIYTGGGVKKGMLKSNEGMFNYFTSSDIGQYWENLSYEATPAELGELPAYFETPVYPVETGFELAEDVSKIEVMHVYTGRTSEWAIEGESIEDMRKWLSVLECRKVVFEKGNTLGDTDGGEMYSFCCVQYSSTVGAGFSYVKNGENECYLNFQGEWYAVLNPSDPPLEEPENDELYVEVTENFVTEIGKGTLKQAIELSEEDTAKITDILDSEDWELNKSADCMQDCLINIAGRLFHYHSECGTITEINVAELSYYNSEEPGAIGNILRLDEENKELLNNILKKYISLENVTVF